MAKIFISYRRSESEYAAGSLGRELRRLFGDEQVFRDKEDIGGGVSWKQHVLDEIDHASALLVLMGKNWATVTDAQGRRRLDNGDDPIRLEIADALKDGAVVIPVLLENAEMPDESELPTEIRGLSDLNALRLRDGDWQHDIDKISAALRTSGFEFTRAGNRRHGQRVASWVMIALLVLSLAAMGTLGYSVLGRKQTAMPPASQKTPLPRLNYGVWTLKGAFDVDSEKHVLDDSTLKFTSQSETADGLLLEGTFTWRVDGVLLGEEVFKGHYDPATRGVYLEGVAVTEVPRREAAPGAIVLGSYSAVLSADERALIDGRNGSTAASPNVPLQWEGVR